MKTRGCIIAVGSVVALWANFSSAHHSAAAFYDVNDSIQVRGTLVDLNLQNPHSLFVVEGSVYIDGRRQDDSVDRWEIESPGTIFIRRWGIENETFGLGDLITIVGEPSRNPESKRIFARRFVSSDGTSFSSQGGSEIQFASIDEVEGQSGIQRLEGLWRRVEAGGADQPLNEAGLAAVASFDPALSPANTCETFGIPGVFFTPGIFGVNIDDQEITLHYEYYDVIRTLTLDAPPQAFGQNGALGVASARIEGDTLVVNSEGFPASMWGLGQARRIDVPSSEMKKVTERYTLTEDGLGILFEVSVEDPAYLSETWSERRTFRRIADGTPLYPYECDLSGASFFSEDL